MTMAGPRLTRGSSAPASTGTTSPPACRHQPSRSASVAATRPRGRRPARAKWSCSTSAFRQIAQGCVYPWAFSASRGRVSSSAVLPPSAFARRSRAPGGVSPSSSQISAISEQMALPVGRHNKSPEAHFQWSFGIPRSQTRQEPALLGRSRPFAGPSRAVDVYGR